MKKLNIVLHDIRKQINEQNKNYTVCAVGPLGSGKSFIAIRFAELISDRFTLDNVVFSAKDFLKLINSGKLKRGDSIVWDELSLEMFSRDFMTIQNKTLVHFMTIYRTMNLFTIFTCPTLAFIDVAVRRLLSAVIEPITIRRKKQENVFKFKRIVTDSLSGKIRYVFPRIVGQYGSPVTVKKMIFKKSEYADEYEKMRSTYALKIGKKSEEEILFHESKEKKKRLTDDKIFELGNKEGIDWNDTNKVCARFQIARDRVYRIRARNE